MASPSQLRLPAEILSLIWENLTDIQRIIEVPATGPPDLDRSLFRNPVVLDVCRESRRVGLKRFERVQVMPDIKDGESPPKSIYTTAGPREIWINPLRDIAYVGPYALMGDAAIPKTSVLIFACRTDPNITSCTHLSRAQDMGRYPIHSLHLHSFLPRTVMTRVVCWDAITAKGWSDRPDWIRLHLEKMFPKLEGDIMFVEDTYERYPPILRGIVERDDRESTEKRRWVASRE